MDGTTNENADQLLLIRMRINCGHEASRTIGRFVARRPCPGSPTGCVGNDRLVTGRGVAILDLSRYFLVILDAIGAGDSSKPSDGLHTNRVRHGICAQVSIFVHYCAHQTYLALWWHG